MLVGLCTGVISGFFGSGGGMILVPFYTHVLKLDEITSRATTIFCITFMVLTSSFFYINQNFVDFNLSIKIAIGGIIGAVIGSKLLLKLSTKILKIIFILFLIYTGIKMMV